MVERRTEEAFLGAVRGFLARKLPGRMPQLVPDRHDGRIPTGARLRAIVDRHLDSGAGAVIALTDVYTGTGDFDDAADAKTKMRQWVPNETRFHPHAAQYDFEAWLIPYWERIQALSGTSRGKPPGNPELLNHVKPASRRIKDVFAAGKKRFYSKTRDGKAILAGQDLTVAAAECAELKSLLNTILSLCGGATLE